MLQNFDSKFYKKLASIALPIALQSLISSSLTLLDNLMVGSLGELSLTSVGLATQGFYIEWMMIFGFCTGSATFFTQFWGVRDLKNIRKVIGLALATCTGISLLFFIAGFFFPVSILSLFTNEAEVAELGAVYLKYAAINFVLVAMTQPFAAALRATQQTKIPMYISIASFVTDAVFNYLLIFGKFGFPKMGVAGAAIATVIARALEFTVMLIAVFGKQNIISGKLSEFFSFDRNFAKRVYSNASITTINETLWCSAVVAENAAYGHLGVTAYAAVQAARTISDMFQLAIFSVGDASMILIGEQIGKNEMDEAKTISKKLLRTALVLGSIMTILLICVHRPLISLFDLTVIGAEYARKTLVIMAISIPFNLIVGILISGTLRAGGDVRFAAITEISVMYLYAVPAAFTFALVLKLPIYLVIFLVQIETLIKLVILLKRYYSSKWLKNMISGM